MKQLRLVALCALVVGGCCSSEQAQTSTTNASETAHRMSALQLVEQIPPNYCRIVGMIVSIDSAQMLSSDTSGPCAKAPCRAIVRVDSVLGYGSAFPQPLSVGQAVPVVFTFTLAPTNTLFPDVDPPYPGLTIGSLFVANVRGMQGISVGENQVVRYSIAGYVPVKSH
jgi:hypothetical protein